MQRKVEQQFAMEVKHRRLQLKRRQQQAQKKEASMAAKKAKNAPVQS